jgi:hypothetical protein
MFLLDEKMNHRETNTNNGPCEFFFVLLFVGREDVSFDVVSRKRLNNMRGLDFFEIRLVG